MKLSVKLSELSGNSPFNFEQLLLRNYSEIRNIYNLEPFFYK